MRKQNVTISIDTAPLEILDAIAERELRSRSAQIAYMARKWDELNALLEAACIAPHTPQIDE